SDPVVGFVSRGTMATWKDRPAWTRAWPCTNCSGRLPGSLLAGPFHVELWRLGSAVRLYRARDCEQLAPISGRVTLMLVSFHVERGVGNPVRSRHTGCFTWNESFASYRIRLTYPSGQKAAQTGT